MQLEIKSIRLMNETMIKYLQKMGMKVQRNEIIKKVLEDEACFFKIDKNDAYSILQDVGIANDKIETAYVKLISKEQYYELKKLGKITGNEKDLKVKYDEYKAEELFKRKK